jgi:hypothetical protein
MSPPRWQREVGRIVNLVGPPVEAVTRRDEFAIAVGLARTVRGELQRRFERQSKRALHLFNLPAGSDIRALRQQVASLERQLREVAKLVEESAPDGAVRRPR